MRPSRDAWAMRMALLTAERSTCLRRHVGCVLLNTRGHVLATGYNGVASGQPHCNERVHRQATRENPIVLNRTETTISMLVHGHGVEHPHACSGAHSPSGTNLDGCQAIHAEQNALLQCRDIYSIDTCYVTASPCMTCVKLLLNTSCHRIVFLEPYPHPAAQELWVGSGRAWEQLTIEPGPGPSVS